ncbi:MAG: hypothetical protein LIP05_09570 [Tannerellaceae bacterium]|nr:hypothetical protein [Tannerellaceae bacterium]
MEQSRYGQRNQFFISPPFEKATLPGWKPSFSLSLKNRVAIKNSGSVRLPDERALNVSRWVGEGDAVPRVLPGDGWPGFYL